MADGKIFAAEFALRRNVKALDKILIEDSDDGVVKYAFPPQIASLSGYAYAQSVADLPLLPSNKSIGYIVGQMLYIYVGMGGDTKDGLYQSVGFFVGPQGVQGEKGEKGEKGEQGIQGPKGDNGGLSLQELDEYLGSKQYVTVDTLADMLKGYVSNTSLMRDYVTIAKTQDVTGVKNFTTGLQFGGVPMYKSKGDTVFLDGNLVVRGGITAFGTNETISPSIFEALPIDGATLKRTENGVLYVDTNVVGGGGSGGGSVDPSQLEAYLKPYAKTADVASTYATIASLSAVTSRLNDFLSGSDTDAIINKWSELETFLAGLTETDNLATILSGKANKATTLAGYGITDAYTKSHIDSNFVTIGTKQQITGEKDFVGGFKVNGGLVEYNATLKAWVLNGDLLVTGGVSAFSNIEGFTPSTITDAVLIDNVTIKRNSVGALYVASGSDDGGIDEAYLAEYLTANNYAKKSDINSALTDYATQSWVTGRGYFLASNFTKVNIKNTLGISDWALASAKPTYTAQEVGAVKESTTLHSASLNDFITAGIYRFNVPADTTEGMTNFGNLFVVRGGTQDTLSQLYFNHDGDGRIFVRSGNKNNYTSRSWKTLAFTSDIPTSLKNPNALSWSGYSSGGYDGSTAQSITIPNNTNQLTNGAGFITSSLTGTFTATGYIRTSKYIETGYLQLTSGIDDSFRTSVFGDAAGWGRMKALRTGGYATGNYGVLPGTYTPVMAFAMADTHAFIAIPYAASKASEVVVGGGNADKLNWAATLLHSSNYSSFAVTLDATAQDIQGVKNFVNGVKVGGSNAITYDATQATFIFPTNILATGGITAQNSSDERLKRNIRKFNASKVLMSLGGVWEYEYIDSEVQKNHIYEGTHYGLIYQHVKGTTLDVMCHKREDGMGALNYLHPKFISLIAGATMENISEVEKLKRKIRHLENTVKQLESRA